MWIAYFDGHCNVCNRFVDYCLRHDKRGILKFAALQGKAARERLPASLVNEMSTMVLQNGASIETESTAAIRTLALLGGIHSLLVVFLLVPRFLRDFVYRWVARHRYLFAGRRAECRIPSAEERARFLES